eukprot:jgi/Antlo1/2401/1999
MAKVLIRNSGRNVEEDVGKMESGEYKYEEVPENLCVLMRVLVNSCTAAMNLLLVDEIIKAGKSMKEEKQA